MLTAPEFSPGTMIIPHSERLIIFLSLYYFVPKSLSPQSPMPGTM